MAHPETTAKTPPTHHPKLLNLFGRKRIASLQFVLNNLVPHPVLKILQLSSLSQNGVGISFWIGPKGPEFQPLGHESPYELSVLLYKVSTQFLELCLLLRGEVKSLQWTPGFLAVPPTRALEDHPALVHRHMRRQKALPLPTLLQALPFS
jgi:hypothetical protein